jgi:hypothetical protein
MTSKSKYMTLLIVVVVAIGIYYLYQEYVSAQSSAALQQDIANISATGYVAPKLPNQVNNGATPSQLLNLFSLL